MRLAAPALALLLGALVGRSRGREPADGPSGRSVGACAAGRDGVSGCTPDGPNDGTEELDGTLGAKAGAKVPLGRRRNKAKDRGYYDDGEDDSEGGDDDSETFPPLRCGLYLAPSLLPYAGLGLYSGTRIPKEQSVNEYVGRTFEVKHSNLAPLWADMFIPIADHYKALPYRGQQRFPSWLAYVWPDEEGAFSDFDAEPFPSVPEELWDFDTGLDQANGLEFYLDDLPPQIHAQLPDFEPVQQVSALAPGIASLANHIHGGLANIDRSYKSFRDYNGQEAPWHPGAGAFTPHYNLEFLSMRELRAGTELLMDYGVEWNDDNLDKLSLLHAMEKNKQAAARKRGDVASDVHQRKGFVEGIDKKWDVLDRKEWKRCPKELPTEKAKRDRIAVGKAADSSTFEDGFRPYSEYRENDFHPSSGEGADLEFADPDYPTSDEQLTRPLPWLEKHGVCLSSGRLRIGVSPIEHAGRGVFATARIKAGGVLLTSPLIAMRREDFAIYRSDEEAKLDRNILDKDRVVGTELLLNYAFTHPDSPLYLVPTAPLANFINHGGSAEGAESSKANVQIRWPEDGSSAAKMFQWTYNQKYRNRFDNDFHKTEFNDANPWLRDHPIDVMERSGKLAWEYVALRAIKEGEEILINYGDLWADAWEEYDDAHPYARGGYFRHALGVPEGIFPDNWLNVGDRYEIAEVKDCQDGSCDNKPLEPGVVMPMTWAHNGKPVSSKYAYVVGLEKGFSERFLKYSEDTGIIELYRKLLTEQEGYHLQSDGFAVYANTTHEAMEFFAHRYQSTIWNFNLHFVAAWSDTARRSILTALGDAGFDLAVKGIGERFGYDNMTCFLSAYIGVSHCDKSKMHSDIYATDNKSWNIVFLVITVDGTDPELDIMAEDMNTVIGVHYLKDVAYAIGDFGYHKTRPIDYYDPAADGSDDNGNKAADGAPIRVVHGTYCSQIDETNVAMIRHIYDGDDPSPFADQFVEVPMREVHWDGATGTSTLAKPRGRGL